VDFPAAYQVDVLATVVLVEVQDQRGTGVIAGVDKLILVQGRIFAFEAPLASFFSVVSALVCGTRTLA
jgi:hypothetical protein